MITLQTIPRISLKVARENADLTQQKGKKGLEFLRNHSKTMNPETLYQIF